jgi:hypothetical protein
MKSVNQFYKLEIARAKSGVDQAEFQRRNRWTYRKLGCDIIFASESARTNIESPIVRSPMKPLSTGYTVFDITKSRELVQNTTGLIAGLIR